LFDYLTNKIAIMKKLNQPIFSNVNEPGHLPKQTLYLKEFINLLKEEEDYYPGEQHNTKLMISRLRKIFYDQWGWNSELIRGAANVKTRYTTKIVDDKTEHSKQIRRYKNQQYQPKHRVIVYTDHDKVYGATRAGEVPPIYKNDHQEVKLPEGNLCDMAHILAGLDAYNYPQLVSPLPNWLFFIAKLFPYVERNIDLVTWLGDIGSNSGDFLFKYLNNGKNKLSIEEEQFIIDKDSPGSDMLGNIDAFIIAKNYAVSASNGMRLSEIFEDYYFNNGIRLQRIAIFCKEIGLENWDGTSFSNEKSWLTYYTKQLKNNVCFQVFSLTNETIASIFLPLKIWFGGYKTILKKQLSLELFLDTLKKTIDAISLGQLPIQDDLVEDKIIT